jgi:hypothetical protein
MPVKYTQTFRAPTEYERQLEEARRRAMLAEALAQQQYEPMEGNAAPIPRAAPLVKALQSFMTARAGRQAQEAAEEAKGMEADYAQRMLGRMQGGYVYDPAAATPAAIPEQTELGEVTRQSQYRRAPEEVLDMASTSLGTAALKDRPVMAQRLAQMLETPKEAEYGTTPQFDAEGRAFVVNKAGNVRYLDGVKAPAAAPAAVTPTTIVKDGRRVVIDARTGREIGAAPESSPLVVNYGSPVAGVDEQGNPVFFQPSKGGGQPAIVPGVRPSPKGMNEAQAKAAGFADRLVEASPLLDTSPPSVGASVLSGLPGGNFALTPNQQSFLQAERNFINAVLRRESGAVISDEEFDNARKQYIPQPGDSQQVLEQKRRNRETVQRSFMRDAGPSYQPVIDLPPRR